MTTMRPFGLLKTAMVLFMVMAACLPAAKAQTTEDGTAEHPFLIESRQELLDFNVCMRPGNQFYHNGETFVTEQPTGAYQTIPAGGEGKYFKLTTNVEVNVGDVAGCCGVKEEGWYEWLPMVSFSGHFDGDFHTVSGLYYVETDPAKQVGFFMDLTHANSSVATVKNLGVTNTYFAGPGHVGGIAGSANPGNNPGDQKCTIDHCFFEGFLECTGTAVGGIAGSVAPAGTGLVEITNCYSTGMIYATNASGPAGSQHGGIVGDLHANGSVSYCYSTMWVQGESNTGAIYGSNGGGTVNHCFYDKQMSDLTASSGTNSMFTSAMLNASWNGMGDEFVATLPNAYPYLRGFNYNDNPYVRFSVLPILLSWTSDSQYDEMSTLSDNFTVGTLDGSTWTVVSGNDAVSLSGNTVVLNRKGLADLIVSMGDKSRTYVLLPQKGPEMGTEENPFIIETLSDLKVFRDGISYGGGSFMFKRMKANNDVTNHWRQVKDIDLSSEANWVPVGGLTDINAFRGYYHGGGHKIQNMTITTGANDQYCGMFSKIENAHLDSIFLENCTVNSAYNSTAKKSYTGGLVAYASGSTISYCDIVSSDISSSVTRNQYEGTNYDYIGGICGQGVAATTISYCKNIGTTVHSYTRLGGIAGSVNGENSLITQCQNSGSIIGSVPGSGGNHDQRHAGGIVADVTGLSTVSYCLNTGTVSSPDDIGGIVAMLDLGCSILNCINTGSLYPSTVSSSVSLGGMVGYFRCSGTGTTHTVKYCINTGEIIGNTPGVSPWNVGGLAGGVSGSCRADVQYCFNAGNVYPPENSSYFYGGISGSDATYNDFCLNVGRVQGSTNKMYPIGYHSTHSLYDAQTCYGTNFQSTEGAQTTQALIGTSSVAQSELGNTDWIYEEGRYPRLAWTEDQEWARDIAIAASTPMLLTTGGEDVDHVKPGMKLYGCEDGVEWQVIPPASGTVGGCLFANNDFSSLPCVNNTITPELSDACIGATEIQAVVNGEVVKRLNLKRYISPGTQIMTINSLADLETLRNGVNSGDAFYYPDHSNGDVLVLLPQFADSVFFQLTADITMPDANWTPIGNGSNQFGGVLLGGNHTISNLHCDGSATNGEAGLFGKVGTTGHGIGRIQDLNVTDVHITGGNYKGAVCAQLVNGKLVNCTASGTISGGNFYAGGLVGYAPGKDTIDNCTNYATVIGDGSLSNDIISQRCAGGILGYGGENALVKSSLNVGEVIGAVQCTYTGGICGNGQVLFCYNVGAVSAQYGNNTAKTYVGGITGYGNPEYCYNAGVVNGANRMYTGGITGFGTPQYCYNSNTVRATGTYKGSICGNKGTGTLAGCFNDQQLSPLGCVNGEDQSGRAESKVTTELLGNALSGSLGTAANWVFTADLYPQLATTAGTDQSVSSVMPVCLNGTETWDAVRTAYTMRGCNTTSDWQILSGNCVSLNGPCAVNNLSVSDDGVVVMGARVNGTVYRTVRLLVNISEETPLYIKDETEMAHFRDVINNGHGYYKMSDYTYYSVDPSDLAEHPEYYMEILDGGADLYFKLIVDLDMSGAGTWSPVGSTDHPFKGHFLGNHHMVTNLSIGAGDYQGLFGYMDEGEIRDLTIAASAMTGNGSHKGLLCGMSNGGTIENCLVTNSEVAGACSYTGVLCGSNNYAFIRNSHANNNTVSSTGSYVGGICSWQSFGEMHKCYSTALTMTGNGDYKGGVLGFNDEGTMDSCLIQNTTIDVSGSYVGGVCGVNRGYYRNTSDRYVLYPAIMRNCASLNTDVTSSGYRVGGIVGSSDSHASYLYTCATSEGRVVSTSGSGQVGGIVGYQGQGTFNNCYNGNEVEGTTCVGGIAGYINDSRLDTCYNMGKVTGSGELVGGIAGYAYNSAIISQCANAGTVSSESNYVGGITGKISHDETPSIYNINTCVINSFNTGMVSGANRVGGIVGCAHRQTFVRNSYNTGIVKGVALAGGILGELETPAVEKSYNNYNAGWVEGVSMSGAICGYTTEPTFLENCYYDMQMSHFDGMDDEVMIGRAEPKLTSEMLGTGLQSLLGDEDWKYTVGMYPTLKGKMGLTPAAIASITPVLLPVTSSDTTFARNLSQTTYSNVLGGCTLIDWVHTYGYGIAIDGCSITVTGRNRVRIANKIDGDTLKQVQLVLNISEEQPIEIVSLEQLKNFRNLINSNHTFYYNFVNKTFLTSVSASDILDVIEIPAGGDRMYFKLTTDIDLTAESVEWLPIGDYVSNTDLMFRGVFDGGDHIVKGLKITGDKDYQGFFGYVQGTVKNLRMVKPNITATGNYHGAIAGYNYGTILNSSTVDGKVQGTEYVGGISGSNEYNKIAGCYNGSAITGVRFVGGIAGNCNVVCVITRCFNFGMITATAEESYVSGIVGKVEGEVSYCYNTGVINGNKYTAGISGWSQSPYVRYCYNAGYVNSPETTHIGAVVVRGSGDNNPVACFYDKQLCHLPGGVGSRTGAPVDIDGVAEGLYTHQIVGSALESMLGSEEWTYKTNEYPSLAVTAATDGSYVSVKPIHLPDNQEVMKIRSPFTAQLGDGVEWNRHGLGVALNVSNLSTGEVGLTICGVDTLKVALGQTYRLVPVHVTQLAAAAVVDTACDGFYLWAVTGRMYTSEQGMNQNISVLLPAAVGCDSVLQLNLTIPPALAVDITSQNRRCFDDKIDYIQANISGGFNQGYNLTWIKDDEIIKTSLNVAATDSVSKRGPGNYKLIVQDVKHLSCEKTVEVTITEPTKLVASTSNLDGHCYNTDDGTIDFSVSGGTLPYTVSWTGTATGSLPTLYTAGTGTVNGLADGTYTVTIADGNGCSHVFDNQVIGGDTREYSITAMGVNRKYDGTSVDLGYYTLKIGTDVEEVIASGNSYTTTEGVLITAAVSQTGTVKDFTTGITNNITSLTMTKGGEDVLCRYNVTSHNSPVEISKRNITLTSASANMVFNGSTTHLTAEEVTVSGDGFVENEGIESYTYSGHQDSVGSSDNTFDYTLKSSNDETKAINYNINKVYGNLVVGTADAVTIIASSASKKYDGTPLTSPSYSYVGPVAATDTVIATVSGSITDYNATPVDNVINAGYKIVAKSDHSIDHTGYYSTIETVSGTLTITQRELTLSTVSASKVYDGTPLSRPTVTLSGDPIIGSEFTYAANTSITNVSESPVTNVITITEGPNYKAENYVIHKNEGTLTITARPLELVGQTSTVAYNGQEQEITGITPNNLVAGQSVSGITYSAKGTDPNTYTGTFSIGAEGIKIWSGSTEVTGNYSTPTQTAGSLEIIPNPLTLSIASNTGHFTYDGQPHKYQSYTVIYNGQSIAAKNDTLFGLNATDTVVIHPTDAGRNGILNVSQNVAQNNTYEVELRHQSTTVTLHTYYSTVAMTTGDIVIDPKTIYLRSKTYNEPYSGHAIPSTTVAHVPADDTDGEVSLVPGYEFVAGQGVVCTIANQYTAAGTYSNTFSVAAESGTNLANYDIHTMNGGITIQKVTLTVAAEEKTKIYGNDNPELTYTITGFVNGEESSIPYVGDARPQLSTTAQQLSTVGEWNIAVDLTGVEITNYTLVAAPGTLTIYRRPFTVTAHSKEDITYNGEEHSWQELPEPRYTLTAPDANSGLLTAEGDVLTDLTLSGYRTVGGTSDITLSNPVILRNGSENVTDNYEMVPVNGALTIHPVAITLRPYSFTHEFDGNTYNSSHTTAPHYEIISGALVTNDAIVRANITGERSAPGTTYFAIDPASILIVDETEVTGNYESINPIYDMTAGYDITLETSTLTITDRDPHYAIALQAKSQTIVYDGGMHDLSGWETTEFEVDGHTYTVSGITSKVQNASRAGVYDTEITGTAVVTDAYGNDVTSSFTVTTTPGTLTITKRPITITARPVTVEYDATEHTYAESGTPYCDAAASTAVSGLCTGHQISTASMNGSLTIPGSTTISINSVTIVNAGNQDVTENYEITKNNATLTVNPRTTPFEQTVAANSLSLPFNGESQSVNGYEETFIVNGHSFTVRGLTASGATGTNVGNYDNTLSGTAVVMDEGNNDMTSQFNISLEDGNLEITTKDLTIRVNDAMAHNGSPLVTEYTSAAVSAEGLVDGDVLTGGVVTTNSAEVGAYYYPVSSSITTLFATNKGIDNYEVTYIINQTISNQLLYITNCTELTKSQTYSGASFASTEPTVKDQADNVVTDATLSYSIDGGSWQTELPSFTDAGTYAITARATKTDYTQATCAYTMTVTPIEITVTADSKTRPYYDANPPLTYTLNTSAFVGGEDVSVITGAPELSTTAALASLAGTTYPIVPDVSTMSATNYTFTPVNGTLTVEKADVTVKITGNSDTKVYNGSEQSVSGYSQEISHPQYNVSYITYSGTDADKTAAGTDVTGSPYSMSMTTTMFGNTNDNFNASFEVTNGTLTITPATMTLATTGWNAMYDGAAHTASATPSVTTGTTVEYYVNDVWTTTAPSIKDFGSVTYNVRATNPNYTTVNATVTLAVSKRAVAMTSATDTKVYDGTALTRNAQTDVEVTGDGFVAGEGATYDITGTQTDAGSSANTFTYALNSGTEASNYSINTYNGVLTVTRATMTLVAEDYNAAYDADAHGITATPSVTAGTTLSYSTDNNTWSTTAPTWTDVTPAQTVYVKAENSNYFTVSTSATVTITPASATVNIVGAHGSHEYDGQSHSVSGYTATTTAPGYDVDHDILFSGTATAERTVVGTTNMNLEDTQFTNNNTNFDPVTFNVTDGYQTIGCKTVTVTANANNKDYGADEPTLTATVDGLVSGESEDLISYAVTRAAGEYVGTYTITPNGAPTQGNYCVTYETGTFTINPVVLITTTPMPGTICSGTTLTVNFDATISGSNGTMSFTWTRDNNTGDVTGDDSGNGNIAVALSNTTANPQTTTFTVTPTFTPAGGGTPVDGAQKTFSVIVRPSVLTSGNITFVCPDTTVTLNYGVCDTIVELFHTPFASINQMSGMTIVLDSANIPSTHRYSADYCREHGAYTITWTVTDECHDHVDYTQHVMINYPPCEGTITDVDDNIYPIVQVGCNCWMGANMRTTRYANAAAVTPAPMQYPGTEQHPEDTIYGKLYDYYAATKTTPPTRSRAALAEGQGICPTGWHIPDDEDFADLMSHFDNMGDLMSTEHWVSSSEVNNTNNSGFNLEPAGMYNSELNRYENLYVETYLWSYTPGSIVHHACEFGSACGTIEIILSSGTNGYSVRCVKDSE